MRSLLGYCDYIMGNEEDFAKMVTGEDVSIAATVDDQVSQFRETARLVFDRFPSTRRLYSSIRIAHSVERNTWAAASVSEEGDMVVSSSYELDAIVDRIGSGDAFAAGLIYANLKDFALDDEIAYGAAAGALCHTVDGDFLTASSQEIRSQVDSKQHSSRIQR